MREYEGLEGSMYSFPFYAIRKGKVKALVGKRKEIEHLYFPECREYITNSC